MSPLALPAAVNARGYNISVSIAGVFFTITLVGTQNVIEELALPQHGLS